MSVTSGKPVKLGRLKGTGKYVHIAEDADNSSLLVLGRSGSGKTYALQQIEQNITENGGCVLIINFNQTHDLLNFSENQRVKRISVRSAGYPFPLFCRIPFPDGHMEEDSDITESILEIFSGTLPLPVRQKAELRRAVQQVVEHSEMWQKGIYAVGELLLQRDEEAAWRVYDKFHAIFRGIEFRAQEEAIFSPGEITILDLGDYAFDVQHFLAEMTLAILYRYFCVWGRCANQPLFVVLDEFQVLRLTRNSILAHILREGRKHNLALLLATQTLETFNKEQVAVIRQAATQLYFRPDERCLRHLKREYTGENWVKKREKVASFQRGECIAAGRFQIGNMVIKKPIFITFRERRV